MLLSTLPIFSFRVIWRIADPERKMYKNTEIQKIQNNTKNTKIQKYKEPQQKCGCFSPPSLTAVWKIRDPERKNEQRNMTF